MTALDRAQAFCERVGARVPIFLAPMAGASPPSLSIAVANAGGLGACGVLVMRPDAITAWADEVRAGTAGGFQLNDWIPDPPPVRNGDAEAAVRAFLEQWGPPVDPSDGDLVTPDFDEQCEAMLAARPTAISSIMGLFPPAFVDEMKRAGVLWFATATTLAEARLAEDAGADVIVAQGMEAGGHRGAFDPSGAERRLVGLFALLPAVVDAVRVPVIATGGIADARGVAAALVLGASAVQIGTGFLRCPESDVPEAWADALGRIGPEDTMVTRAFSGLPGRAIANAYAVAAAGPDAPPPAPYPVQRGLTTAMRVAGAKAGDADRMQMWSGQSAGLATTRPAGEVVADLWAGAQELLGVS